MLQRILKFVLFWTAVVVLFFYFCVFEVSEVNGYKKMRIATKSGYGLIVRMKDGGWELWLLNNNVESSRVFPLQTENLIKPGESNKLVRSVP